MSIFYRFTVPGHRGPSYQQDGVPPEGAELITREQFDADMREAQETFLVTDPAKAPGAGDAPAKPSK